MTVGLYLSGLPCVNFDNVTVVNQDISRWISTSQLVLKNPEPDQGTTFLTHITTPIHALIESATFPRICGYDAKKSVADRIQLNSNTAFMDLVRGPIL